MRYYEIVITGAPAVFTPISGSKIPGAQFGTILNGQNNPNALRCTLHIEIYPAHLGTAKGFVRIWGVSIDMLSASSDLTNKYIEVYGGFTPGLPLASKEAVFAGKLFTGTITAVFGNWEGLDLTMDLYITPSSEVQQSGGGGTSPGAAAPAAGAQGRFMTRNARVGSPRLREVKPGQLDDNPLSGIAGDIGSIVSALTSFGSGGWLTAPLNLIHNMMQGTPLDSALQQTLSAAFKGTQIITMIQSGLSQAFHDAGFYQSLPQYAGYIKSLSKSLSGSSSYPGISIWPILDTLVAADMSQGPNTLTLDFEDLIGQPTWSGQEDGQVLLNFKTPMRGDIKPAMWVVLPQALQFLSPGENFIPTAMGLRSLQTTFAGPIWITRMMIIGDSRHPAGGSWALSCTGVVGGAANTAASAAIAAGLTLPGTPATAPQRLVARNRHIGRGHRPWP